MNIHTLFGSLLLQLMKIAPQTVSTSYNGLPVGRCKGNWLVVRLSEGCFFQSNIEYAVSDRNRTKDCPKMTHRFPCLY